MIELDRSTTLTGERRCGLSSLLQLSRASFNFTVITKNKISRTPEKYAARLHTPARSPHSTVADLAYKQPYTDCGSVPPSPGPRSKTDALVSALSTLHSHDLCLSLSFSFTGLSSPFSPALLGLGRRGRSTRVQPYLCRALSTTLVSAQTRPLSLIICFRTVLPSPCSPAFFWPKTTWRVHPRCSRPHPETLVLVSTTLHSVPHFTCTLSLRLFVLAPPPCTPALFGRRTAGPPECSCTAAAP